MRAYILQGKEINRRSLYVPDAHIQIYLYKSGDGQWVIAAFRTDGYYGRTREEAIPTVQHLQEHFRWLGEVEVPERAVKFAVASEAERQRSVERIAQILERAATDRDPKMGFMEFRNHLTGEDPDGTREELEQEIGNELEPLLASGGQQ